MSDPPLSDVDFKMAWVRNTLKFSHIFWNLFLSLLVILTRPPIQHILNIVVICLYFCILDLLHYTENEV